MILALVTLLLTPWHGPSLPTATPAAAKYRLEVRGPAGGRVLLHAGGLPSGWVASFCTQDLCSPFSYRMQLDGRGEGQVEFQAVRTGDTAPESARVTITADGAKPISVRVRR